MSPYNGPHASWWKIATFALPLLAGAIIAFTRVQSHVDALAHDLDKKADAAVVQANQEAILRELNDIQRRLDKLVRPLVAIP